MEIPENQIILKKIAEEVGVTTRQTAETLRLLEEGGTIPFIARYRKEATGNFAEWGAENAGFRKGLREMVVRDGLVVSRALKGKEGEKTKFEMYYDFREPVPVIP